MRLRSDSPPLADSGKEVDNRLPNGVNEAGCIAELDKDREQ
jgi:hypothetical protein